MHPRASLALAALVLAAGLGAAPASHRTPATDVDRSAGERWFAEVSRAIAAEEYSASVRAAGLQAPNRAQGIRALFGEAGITVVPRAAAEERPAWQFEWRLARWGRRGRMAAAEPVAPAANGARVTYARSGLLEWYENTARGLEQGFEVSEAPAGEGPVRLEGEAAGLRLEPDAGGVDFLDAGGARVLRYAELTVFDAAGRDVPARVAATGSMLSIEIDDAGATYPLLVDPLMTSPAWTAEGEQAGASFGVSVATAGDVNGDGFSDVIVGARDYDNGQADEGRAFVYLGSAAGLGTTPAWTAESDQATALFGGSVATAGDVNGDGFSDVIVGARFFDNGLTNEGRAFVYLGSAGGLATAPAWTAESNQTGAALGTSVATAGDVNGDGFSDVIVGADFYSNGEENEGRAFVYLGSAAGLAASPAWTAESDQASTEFGRSVATAGDVNGDGFSDVIVGADRYDNGQADEGRTFVYLGSAAGLGAAAAWTAEANQDFAYFGVSVAAAGDVNGDGFADVIVGARLYDNGQNGEGRAFLYLGSAAGVGSAPAWTAEGDQFAAEFGRSVATAGDVNGDGFGDVIIGALQFDGGEADEGRAFVYLGSAAGLTTPFWTAESNQAGALFGCSVASAGDVNGDGYSDVIVGALQFDNGETDEGRAFVYHGSAGGLAAAAGWTVESDQALAALGTAVGTAGDVNGDGYSDVIVAAPQFDNGQFDEGRAFLHLGAAGGPGAAPAWTTEANQNGALLGWRAGVAGAGDVNGDGYSDVIAGAPFYSNGQAGEGRAFLHFGSPAGPGAAPAWTAEPDQANAHFGFSVAGAGDVNGDGYADVIVGAENASNGEVGEGRAFVYLGSAAGLGLSPAWTAEPNQESAFFGTSVGTAGDVNGDGFSDVIIGARRFDNGQNDEGRAFVYLGSAAGLGAAPAWTAESDRASAELGSAVGTAGDVNGDGFSDVIVGAPLQEGRAYVYLGSAAGLAASPAWTGSDAPFAFFGVAVGTAGDVNGDGFSDVIVGANGYDNGQTDEGRAFVYHGSAAGLAAAPSWTAESNQASAGFGVAVGTAGDANGDGFSDVIVGAHLYDNGLSNEGRAFVYYGNEGDGLDRIPRQARAGDSEPIDLLGRSDSPSSFGVKARGRTAAGRGKVQLEWEVKPLGTPFDGTGIARGAVLDTGTPAGGAGSAVALGELAGGLNGGTAYHWRLRIASDSPFFPRTPWLTLPGNNRTETDLRTASPPAGIAAAEAPPAGMALLDARPSPFLPGGEIAFHLPAAGRARLAVYDVAGRLRAVLADGATAAGHHAVRWDVRDGAGSALPAGVYLLRLEAAGREAARKLVIGR